jgi:hypothetical protein
MRKNLNTEHIEGRVYEHDLALKVTGPTSKAPGTEYIGGSIKVAVDEECLNVITVKFTYVTATTSKGGANKTFTALKKIIDGGKTVVADGMDEAMKVKIDTSIALNDFYTENDELVSVKENNGGFVDIVTSLCDEAARNTFKVDMLITGVTRTDADPEKNIDKDFLTIRGAIFNFKNDLLPVDFRVDNPAGMAYFEDLGVTNAEPVYTQVWGKINSLTSKVTITEESAFGESAVRVVERSTKNWTITGAKPTPYDFGEEGVLTVEEVTKAMQDRQTMLAAKKAERDAYLAQKGAAGGASAFGGAATPTTAPVGKFNF